MGGTGAEAAETGAELERLVRRQIVWTEVWHAGETAAEGSGEMEVLVREHHRANFDLWHEEDRARNPASTDAEITQVKRAIDRFNQRRNDLVERIDERLLAAAGAQGAGAPLHSETPGAMLDRLSILALKLFHTREETERTEATEAHRARNRERLGTLEAQHRDLRDCLLALWDDVRAGRRRFQLYRQLKMYNDPELNPVLYRRKAGE